MSAAYERYLEHMQGLHALGSALSLLGWDQETMMPPAAVAHRADVRSHLSGLVHDGTVDPAFGDLLAELQESPLDDDQAANVREMVAAGGARSIRQPGFTAKELAKQINAMAQRPETLANAAHAAWNCGRPKAASDLADLVESFGGADMMDVIRVGEGAAASAEQRASTSSARTESGS